VVPGCRIATTGVNSSAGKAKAEHLSGSRHSEPSLVRTRCLIRTSRHKGHCIAKPRRRLHRLCQIIVTGNISTGEFRKRSSCCNKAASAVPFGSQILRPQCMSPAPIYATCSSGKPAHQPALLALHQGDLSKNRLLRKAADQRTKDLE
jgi:hypothetical protein